MAERLAKLPPFRPSCLHLLAIPNDSASGMSDVASIFRSDPGLKADLLAITNSMEFGAHFRIESVPHALAFLGFQRIRSLAFSIGVKTALGQSPQRFSESIWSHAIATAVIAEALGNLHNISGLYTPALLHDIGRLGLLAIDRSYYVNFLADVFDSMEEANQIEQTLFGLDHCAAGSLIAKGWRLGGALESATTEHHRTTQTDLASQIVRDACQIAGSLGYTEVTVRNMDISDDACQSAGLPPDRIRREIAKYLLGRAASRSQ